MTAKQQGTAETNTNIIPLAGDVQKIMKQLSTELYKAWRNEIGKRLRDLEFQGEITRQDLTVSESVWRLPNTEVRKALSRLQKNLREAGYSYEFRFQDVDDNNWFLSYLIELPEREESDEDNDINDTEPNTFNFKKAENSAYPANLENQYQAESAALSDVSDG